MIRYLLLGLATGGRTTAGPAALALSGHNRRVQVATAVAAGGELVVDKLPATPSRLEPPGLGARAVSAAACGAVLAGRHGDDRRIAAATALTAAGVGALLGTRWRKVAAAHNVWAGLAEDAVVAGLAYLAVRGH